MVIKSILGATYICLAVASFNANAVPILYGFTGYDATITKTLYTVSTTDASLTFVQTLDNSDRYDNSIAYHTSSGLMYHWTGNNSDHPGTGMVMETINLNNASVTKIRQDYTNLNNGGMLTDGLLNVVGSTYDPVTELFYLTGRDNELSTFLMTISADGVWNSAVELPDNLFSLSFFSGKLYAGDVGSNLLYQINSDTGASIDSVGVTLGGAAIDSIRSLTADGMTNTLYALIESSGSQQLATLDPTTGIAISQGTFADQMANIEFASGVPEPAMVWLICPGLLGLIVVTRRKTRI